VRSLDALSISIANARVKVERIVKLALEFVAINVELWDDKH
jgi:hypothetical protein